MKPHTQKAPRNPCTRRVSGLLLGHQVPQSSLKQEERLYLLHAACDHYSRVAFRKPWLPLTPLMASSRLCVCVLLCWCGWAPLEELMTVVPNQVTLLVTP